MTDDRAAPLRLELRGITEQFPGVVANSDVGFAVAPGEIHALLGENGAGKSTLVKIIYGVLHADEGEMLWDGKPVHVADPKAARALGIGMVFQHFSLFEAMTVLENVALGVDGVTDRRLLRPACARSAMPMACRSTPSARSTPSRSASASGSRSSAACCRAHAS